MSTLHDFLTHPIESLERALHIRKQIAQLEKMLKDVMSPEPMSKAEIRAVAGSKRRGRRKMSAAAREKIAAAQRARWAKQKGTAAPASVVKTKRKGGMSEAGRARIAAAQKARWAKVKAGKATTAAAPVKGKRRISAAHRAKLKAAAKARWAKVKKGKV